MTDNFWIPRTLNAPVILFIFQADNFILVTVILTMTGLLKIWYVCIVLSMVLVRAWNELKEAGGQGLVMRYLYWYLPSFLGIKIASNVREYLR